MLGLPSFVTFRATLLHANASQETLISFKASFRQWEESKASTVSTDAGRIFEFHRYCVCDEGLDVCTTVSPRAKYPAKKPAVTSNTPITKLRMLTFRSLSLSPILLQSQLTQAETEPFKPDRPSILTILLIRGSYPVERRIRTHTDNVNSQTFCRLNLGCYKPCLANYG